jgi:hypothetical protein
MKTSELTGNALDWAVLAAHHPSNDLIRITVKAPHYLPKASTSWTVGGALLDHEKINVAMERDDYWVAEKIIISNKQRYTYTGFGPTALIAIARCYVRYKLGYEVDIPEELCD